MQAVGDRVGRLEIDVGQTRGCQAGTKLGHRQGAGDTADEVAAIGAAVKLGCRGVSVGWPAINEDTMAAATAAGLEVASWTVRRRPTADRLEGLGVVAICVEAAALDGWPASG